MAALFVITFFLIIKGTLIIKETLYLIRKDKGTPYLVRIITLLRKISFELLIKAELSIVSP
jgi:hypothetical protein